jgi:hypothetical protein
VAVQFAAAFAAIIFELFRIYQQTMVIGNHATNNLKIYFKKIYIKQKQKIIKKIKLI